MIPRTPAAGRTPAEKAAKCTDRQAVWQLFGRIVGQNGEGGLFHAFQGLRGGGKRAPKANRQTQLAHVIG
jgi:hypothetical protein